MQGIAENIQRIEHIFREVQEQFEPELSLHQLSEKLNQYELCFRSVAYEAASMCIGLRDLKSGDLTLSAWKNFAENYALHATQIYVGLGWALAQEEISFRNISPLPSQRYALKVLDGFGYYDGMFRKRRSIHQQAFPDFLQEENRLHSYDNGLGRNLWYSLHGDINAVKNIIHKFPELRKPHLWQGLGTAVAYVGGCDIKMLHEIFIASGNNYSFILRGALNAQLSRVEANAQSSDTDLAVKEWETGV